MAAPFRLNCFRPATSRLVYSSFRAWPSPICLNRSIATKSLGDAPFACTWLTRTPEETVSRSFFLCRGHANEERKTIDNIVSSLAPSPTKDTTPLILVTPQFAHWLDPSDPFLPKLLGRLYDGTDPIFAVAAVVDKLPSPSSFPTAPSPTNSSLERLELEGLSLLVVPQLNVQGKAAADRRIGGPAREEPDLGISLDSADLTTYQIGLRLAHTIFVNGQDSTLVGMRWTWDKTAGDNGAYALDQSIDLTTCIVKSTSLIADVQSTLRLPLHPVGQRRRVISSMGNILRQVSQSTDLNSTAPMPASSELEKELPRYIAENNIVDQRVSVWALVEKPTAAVSCSQDGLLQSISNGAKLHRVMSGGGGWGKKQGLLSLDPEVNFSGTAGQVDLDHLDDLFIPNRSKVSDSSPPFPDGIVGDDLSMLSQVATEGDFIQFYASGESSPSQQVESKSSTQGETISYCFGIASDAEEIDTLTPSNIQESLIILPNVFGALSEKAITYSQLVPTSTDEDHQGAVERVSGSNTKLDIPGCHVTFCTNGVSE